MTGFFVGRHGECDGQFCLMFLTGSFPMAFAVACSIAGIPAVLACEIHQRV